MERLMGKLELPADIASAAGAVVAVIVALGVALGIVSGTPAEDQLSSGFGIVHETDAEPQDVLVRRDLDDEREIKWTGYQEIDNGLKRLFRFRSA